MSDFPNSCSREEWNIAQGTSWKLHKEAEGTHQLILQEIVLPDIYALFDKAL